MAYGASKQEVSRLILPHKIIENPGSSLVGFWSADRQGKNWLSGHDITFSGASVISGSLGAPCIKGSDFYLQMASSDGDDIGYDWNVQCSMIVLVGKGFQGNCLVRGDNGDFLYYHGSVITHIDLFSSLILSYDYNKTGFQATLSGTDMGTASGPLAAGFICGNQSSPTYVVCRGKYASAGPTSTWLNNDGFCQWNFGSWFQDWGGTAYKPSGEVYGYAMWTRAMALNEMMQRVAAAQAMLDGLEDPSFHSLAAAVQTAYPTSDVVQGLWLPSSAGSPTELYAMLDEVSADDADYIYTGDATTARVALNSVTDPSTSSGHVVHYRCRVYAGTLYVRLKQGTTTIATWSHTSADAGSMTTFAQTLSAGEADSITDYAQLRIEFEAA